MQSALHALEKQHLPDNIDGVSGRYGFVPFPIDDFLGLLTEAWLIEADPKKKFLDVGAGIGTKVLLANVLFDAWGIEIDQDYVDVAQSLGADVKCQDALQHHFYDAADFIYFFVPIKDEEQEQKLERHIHDLMKVGSYVAPMGAILNWNDFSDMEQQGRWFKKCQ